MPHRGPQGGSHGNPPPKARAPLIDHTVLDRLRGPPGDPIESVMKEVLELYRTAAPTLLAGIGAGLDAGDAVSAERAAHSLRGSSLNVGAAALAEALTAVEGALRRGDAVVPRASLPLLEDLLRRTLVALAEEMKR